MALFLLQFNILSYYRLSKLTMHLGPMSYITNQNKLTKSVFKDLSNYSNNIAHALILTQAYFILGFYSIRFPPPDHLFSVLAARGRILT